MRSMAANAWTVTAIRITVVRVLAMASKAARV
jgi:hypothetical protein